MKEHQSFCDGDPAPKEKEDATRGNQTRQK
jgi:hypothetical protein